MVLSLCQSVITSLSNRNHVTAADGSQKVWLYTFPHSLNILSSVVIRNRQNANLLHLIIPFKYVNVVLLIVTANAS